MSKLRALSPFLLAAVFLAAFAGFCALNGLGSGDLRAYGIEWFDRVALKEAELFVALTFLALPATLFLARGFLLACGDGLVRLARAAAARPRVTVAVAAGVALLATVLVAAFATQHAPLTDDEQIYRFQADLLRHGLLRAPAPPSEHPFASAFLVFRDHTWTGVYPWGHVALLSLGQLVGFVHLWPHLAAPAAVVLTYALGRELYPDDARAPLVAAGVIALSPFLAFTAATLHNVTTSTVLVTAGAQCLARAVRRDKLGWAALAGLSFGADLHARTYNAVALGAALGLVALVAAVREKRRVLPLIGGFAAGLAPAVAAYLLVNHQLTGDFFTTITAYATPLHGKRMFGFGSAREMAWGVAHTPGLALGKSGTNFIRLALWTSGSVLSLAAPLALLLGLGRGALDRLLWVPAAALLAAYFFYFVSPVADTGPVYYLDAVPFLALAAGRAWTAPAPVSDRLRAAAGAAFALVALATFWPLQAIAARHVSNSVLGPYRAVEAAGLHHALVFWDPPPGPHSWVVTRRLPSYRLDDDVVYAKNTDQKAPLLAALPDRSTYIIQYPGGVPTVMAWQPGASPDTAPIITPLPQR